jgi:hypothetical protein
MDVAFSEHHSSEGVSVCVSGTGKHLEYPLIVCRWSVLAQLELAFDAGDRNLEGNDAAHLLVAVIVGKVSGPRLLET